MKKVVLLVLDGWGMSQKSFGNAIAQAKKPNLDKYFSEYPLLLLQASGVAVGLQWGDYGNSEAGHLTIGSGRVVLQYSTRINNAIKDESFYENSVLNEAYSYASKSDGAVHIIGLLTAGAVHAQFTHLIALIEMSQRMQYKKTYIHLFTDGKDSGLFECANLLAKLPVTPTTVIGRNYAMDRNKNILLTRVAFDLIANAKGNIESDFIGALKKHYDSGNSDASVSPMLVQGYEGIKTGDALIFFNFREDSMRQIYQMFTEHLADKTFICSMTKYFEDQKTPAIFPTPDVKNNLPEMVSKSGIKQLHVAETVKYAHVTYFINGLNNIKYENEDDNLIKSLNNIEGNTMMRATEISEVVIDGLNKDYGFIIANFANADMIAHTGNYYSTIAGVEAIDSAVGALINTALNQDAAVFITADHGNAEKLVDFGKGEFQSHHDETPVPFILIDNDFKLKNPIDYRSIKEISGIITDVAPTVLEFMGIQQPTEMTGLSLLPKFQSLCKKQ